MGAIAGFMGPFLDYLRPTKSPFLVIQLVAVLVTCYKVTATNPSAAALDSPRFFVPIFVLVCALVPLSFIRRDHLSSDAQSSQADDHINNSKYENDLDSVFKFSRALCLASSIVMLFFYFQNPPVDNAYSSFAYGMIIVQMTTFLLYTALRHFKGEDISNINLFQIAFITAVFFVGSTYLATKIRESGPGTHYLYYCRSKTLEMSGATAVPIVSDCTRSPLSSLSISRVTLSYSFDYRQLSFAVFAICWLVYELFWLKVLFGIVPPFATVGESKSSAQKVDTK